MALAVGWSEFEDDASGRKYYYNKKTGESRWDPPVEEDDEEKNTPATHKWLRYSDDATGASYYYDVATGITQWECPDEYVEGEPDNEDEETSDNPEEEQPVTKEDSGKNKEETKQVVNTEVDSTEVVEENVDTEAESTKEPSESEGTLEWVRHIDITSGKPYFHNLTTNSTTWEQPVRFVDASKVQQGQSSQYKSYVQKVQKDQMTQGTQQVVDPNGHLGRLNSVLGNINTSSSTGAEWQQHVDPHTQKYYYHNAVTGVTQWTKPDAPIQSALADWLPATEAEEVVTDKAVDGVHYAAQAKFNRLTGKYEQLGGDDYWAANGIPTDRADRQMSHFFDISQLEQNRAEAQKKKEKLKRKKIDWKKLTQEKKAKKQKQKNEWLFVD